MSLHQQLLDVIDTFALAVEEDRYPMTGPIATLRAVVELHAPDTELPNTCAVCCCSSWPCWTIRGIARELGIEVP